MNVRISGKTLTAVLLSILLCILCMTDAASAKTYAAAEKNASLTVYFGKDGNGFQGAEFNIYKVADMPEKGTFALSGDFKAYPVSLDNLDSSGWRALAQTLDSYISRDDLEPLKTGFTDSRGDVCFDALSPGLYIVSSERYAANGIIYTLEPFLVSLPKTAETGEKIYDVKASCKFDISPIKPETTELKIQKVWKDDGNQDKRPEEISVQLLKDGEIYDTAVLNKKNNWEYVWKDLDGGSEWQAAEALTPDGYTVSVAREGTTFIMTNTCPEETPPKLPQTGMPWQPVFVLTCGGLLMLLAGIIIRRGSL